jgi:hypothetical protein
LLDTTDRLSVQVTTAEADALTDADRWLILTVLTADPVELPTDLPDLSPLLEALATSPAR